MAKTNFQSEQTPYSRWVLGARQASWVQIQGMTLPPYLVTPWLSVTYCHSACSLPLRFSHQLGGNCNPGESQLSPLTPAHGQPKVSEGKHTAMGTPSLQLRIQDSSVAPMLPGPLTALSAPTFHTFFWLFKPYASSLLLSQLTTLLSTSLRSESNQNRISRLLTHLNPAFH